MKLLFENWKRFLNERIFYVDVATLIPTEELGHGKEHECPSRECEEVIQKKMKQIDSGNFPPIEVCNQKPVVTYKLKGQEDYTPTEKSGTSESFFYVLDGHHRLEAAKRLGIKKIPVYRKQK